MVVDDHAEHRDLVREVLEPIGFTVLEAEDGPSALALAAEIRPDLFFLDISMPGMTGWEVATALRAAGFTEAKIIILSANVGESRPPEGDTAAHDDLIAKPFEVRRLLDRVQVALGLVWVHEAPVVAVEATAAVVCDDRPTREEARELLQFARIGYVRGVAEGLEGIVAAVRASGAEPGARLERLRRAAEAFDMAGLIGELEAIEGDG
jgi:CheY-like chemotaxis protein